MRGLGPSSRAQLAALGIHTLEQLRQHEPVALYARLKQQWPAANMNLLYALIGAQEDMDWRQVARAPQRIAVAPGRFGARAALN